MQQASELTRTFTVRHVCVAYALIHTHPSTPTPTHLQQAPHFHRHCIQLRVLCGCTAGAPVGGVACACAG